MEDYLRNSRTVRFLNVSKIFIDRVDPSYLFKNEILRGNLYYGHHPINRGKSWYFILIDFLLR